jgi:hypothetical protein
LRARLDANGGIIVQLDSKDLALFFKLHRSLMFFVNQRLQVIPEHVADPDDYSALSPECRFKVHSALIKHLDLVEAFVDETPTRLSREELDIVLSWRHLVHGKFYVLRELKSFTVFVSTDAPPIAYGVVPLSQPFEQLVGPHLPVMVQTVLLPFKGQIVYDGLMSTFNIVFGPGVRRSLSEEFNAAKARHGIVTSLPVSGDSMHRKTPEVRPVQGRRGRPTVDRPDLDRLYPAIANFVRGQGHIEIGDQEGAGFVAKAMDYGGLVFECPRVRTLSAAMAALENGLAVR